MIEVAMPIGLYTSCEVSAPCGLCSPQGIIGLLDVPGHLPQSGPHERGVDVVHARLRRISVPQQRAPRRQGRRRARFLDGAVVGSAGHLGQLALRHHGRDQRPEVGTWTSPGDFGDKRGVFTPDWWKLKGSQYGKLKSWRVTPDGTFIDGMKISPITPRDLDLASHHSIRLRIEVKSRRQTPRRGQHLRPRIWQLRPGHRPAADHRALVSDSKVVELDESLMI